MLLAIAIWQEYTNIAIDKAPEKSTILGETDSGPSVTRIIDGDTVEVMVEGKIQKIRVIGINTPETVDPRKKVECFGKEASEYAKLLLDGQKVILQRDPSQSNADRYGRLLRYIILPDGTDFGLRMIESGYAYEYTYEGPYIHQTKYRNAQTKAEEGSRGLWGSGCN